MKKKTLNKGQKSLIITAVCNRLFLSDWTDWNNDKSDKHLESQLNHVIKNIFPCYMEQFDEILIKQMIKKIRLQYRRTIKGTFNSL